MPNYKNHTYKPKPKKKEIAVDSWTDENNRQAKAIDWHDGETTYYEEYDDCKVCYLLSEGMVVVEDADATVTIEVNKLPNGSGFWNRYKQLRQYEMDRKNKADMANL